MQSVLAAVQQLRVEEQDVLALVVFAELSYEEAAAALEVPVGTIRSRLSRVRQHLAALETNGRRSRRGWHEPSSTSTGCRRSRPPGR